MKIVHLRLPPLPGKSIPLALKTNREAFQNPDQDRKYSVQHLETNDQSEQSATCQDSSPNIEVPHTRKLVSSCKAIRVRDKSSTSVMKAKKKVSVEDFTYSDLPPNVTARSWILFQMRSEKTLYSRRSKKQREIASLTKIMNLITFLELLDRCELNSRQIRVRATKFSTSIEGTTAELKHKAEYSVEDLLYGMMLPSGNDAAFLIAELGGYLCQKKTLPGSVEELSNLLENKMGVYANPYLREMNYLAQKIGMKLSNFANPHGLNNALNTSCADDLAHLCTYAMRNPKFRKIVGTRTYRYEYIEFKNEATEETETGGAIVSLISSEKKEGIWQNTNKMLWDGWSGIKTGVTPNAGPCLAASLLKTFNGKEYEFLVILLESESMDARWQEVEKLVNWAIFTRQYL